MTLKDKDNNENEKRVEKTEENNSEINFINNKYPKDEVYYYSLDNDSNEPNKDLEQQKGWFIKLIALLIILGIIVVFVIPSLILEPINKPKRIVSLEEIRSIYLKNISIEKYNKMNVNNRSSLEKMIYYRSEVNNIIKDIASYIARESCPYNYGNKELCYVEALYYFVRNNIIYVHDPVKTEYIESPIEVLLTGSADCDGQSVLLASLLNHIGVENRYVIVKHHSFLLVKVKIRNKEKNIYLDPTCKNCEFGEIPETIKTDQALII